MNDTGKKFMEYTKYRHLSESDQSRGMEMPVLEGICDTEKPVIDLPKVEGIQQGDVSLREVIARRRSLRQYSGEPLTPEELSYLLWCTQGVEKVSQRNPKLTVTLRTVPSAGCRHAFDTYLLINRVEGLKPGLYRFLAVEHKLVEISTEPDIADRVVAGCLGQPFVKTCNVTFLWVAVPYRMNWRYVERGYRYLHLDAGHVCQNLYLAAESIRCGACAIAAFDDDEINGTLGLDGEEQFVIYIGTVGRR